MNTHITKWNDEIEELLKKKQLQCLKYAWIHNKDSEKYYHYHNYIFMINTILTSLSGTSVIMSNGVFKNIDPEVSNLINVIFGGILIFSTGLNSFQHMTNYSEKSSLHKQAAAKFTSLSNNMLKLLALDKASKDTSIDFFNWADTEFTNLQIVSPNPSDYACERYRKDNPQQDQEIYKLDVNVTNNEVNEINEMNETNQVKDTLQEFMKKRWLGNFSE